MIARLINSVRPVWRMWLLFYYESALRQIDPMHPDVPGLVLHINELQKERHVNFLHSRCNAAGLAAWRFACMSLVGGPVGIYHTVKLARIRRRMKKITDCIDREKDAHRDNLRALNHELTQQSVNHAAAQFWNSCRNRAGL